VQKAGIAPRQSRVVTGKIDYLSAKIM
jgi:hypothetical protein